MIKYFSVTFLLFISFCVKAPVNPIKSTPLPAQTEEVLSEDNVSVQSIDSINKSHEQNNAHEIASSTYQSSQSTDGSVSDENTVYVLDDNGELVPMDERADYTDYLPTEEIVSSENVGENGIKISSTLDETTPEETYANNNHESLENHDHFMSFPYPEAFPEISHARVSKWLTYFQGKGRKHFERWLSRSGKYLPLIRQTLIDHQVPESLVYLAMIESGFRPHAYSRARAAGMWQFMVRTGNAYDLKANWWIDERRDPNKSTVAAARHLRDLYNEFDDWFLAAAGYNAGSGKVRRAISRYHSRDYWTLIKHRYLKPETKDYVPKIIAAGMIAHNRDQYGFGHIQFDQPVPFETVASPEPVSLDVIAKKINVSVKELKTLNPELIRGVTPPHYKKYTLKVPVGKAVLFNDQYASMTRYKIQEFAYHKIRRGESVSTIARKYGVSQSKIAAFNGLSSRHRIRAGKTLRIPHPSMKSTSAMRAKTSPTKKLSSQSVASRSKKPQSFSKKGAYRVQKGDTLWNISRKHGISVADIKAKNGITSNAIMPGQSLILGKNTSSKKTPSVLSTKTTKQKWTTYAVRSGDSLWAISRKFGTSVQSIKDWNDLASRKIFPGDTLKIRKK